MISMHFMHLLLSILTSISLALALSDDGVVLQPLHIDWQNWPLFSPEHELVELSIPNPSGILLSEHLVNKTLIRVGRLGHSVLAIREEWAAVHGTEQPVLSLSECEEIIKRTEAYAAEHGWTVDRHAQYPTTGQTLTMLIVHNLLLYFDVHLRYRCPPGKGVLIGRYQLNSAGYRHRFRSNIQSVCIQASARPRSYPCR